MKTARIRARASATFFLLLLVLFPYRALPIASDGCIKDLVAIAEKKYPHTLDEINALQAFAKEYNLPTKVLQVGPPERRVTRFFVGLDATNPKLLEEYRKRFDLNTAVGPTTPGTIPLEFQFEVPGDYVTGVVRGGPNANSPFYRYGVQEKKNMNAADRAANPAMDQNELQTVDWWFTNWMMSHDRWAAKVGPDRYVQDPVFGYAHLIGLSPDEQKNVTQNFLPNPALRGPCKSNNCVAWTSGIELGKTAQGATDQERKYLFNELGVARSSAHFEIGRRLMNAANQRHGAVVVFLNGAKGTEAFKDLPKYLPADPQIKYSSILRGFDNADVNPDLVKAMEQVPDGAHILMPIAAGASPEAFSGLVKRLAAMNKGVDLDLFTNGLSEAELKEATRKLGNKLRLHALFLGSNMRGLYREGGIHLADGNLGDIARSIATHQNPQHKYDAIFVRVSPPDAQGHYSLGPNNDVIMTAIKSNPGIKVIAEINPNIPHATGDNYLTQPMITASFQSNTQLVSPPVVPYEEVEKKIGENLGKLVDDGAYLQVGIGNLFDGLPAGLEDAHKKNLKIFSEMYGDALQSLIDKGIATEARTGFAFGSSKLYKALDRNPKVTLVPTTEVNNPETIAKLPKFDAINTALQVDLRGNVNATMGQDNKAMSSVGGQL